MAPWKRQAQLSVLLTWGDLMKKCPSCYAINEGIDQTDPGSWTD
jgi:hypothetical protein